METASNPRAPFWGCPLGLVSWTEQRSKNPYVRQYNALWSDHFSGVWQEGEHTCTDTQSDLRTQGFLDGRSGRWRDSSDIKSVSVKVSVFVSVCMCTSGCVYMGSYVSESLCMHECPKRMCICFLFWDMCGCVCVRASQQAWHCCWAILALSHTLLISPILCPLCRWHVGLYSSILSLWSLSSESQGLREPYVPT